MVEFRMPSLGADMTEGTLLQWLVHPGDVVRAGDVVAEVDTTKAAIEVECFDDGVIGELLVREGETVPVGAPLATIEPVGEAGAATSGSAVSDVQQEIASTGSAEEEASHSMAEPHEVRATPLVRRLAEKAGLDLATVHGSGPNGRVVRSDVEKATAVGSGERRADAGDDDRAASDRTRENGGGHGPTAAHGPELHARASGYARKLAADLGLDITAVTGTGRDGSVRADDVRTAASFAHPRADLAAAEIAPPPPPVPAGRPAGPAHDLAAVRAQIAAAMTKSKQTVPHYYLSATVDVAAATDWVRKRNLTLPVADRILLPALLLRAVSLAARNAPDLNGHWVDDRYLPATAVHLGVVVSLRGGGIMLPTIPDADTLDPAAMMAALRGVVSRARSGRLRSSDTTPATITVTNLGDLGVDSVFGVIAVPQVAIVGLGAAADRPYVAGGLLGVRRQLTATLSADHRASDGATGARFLNAVDNLLQRPEEL
ncbi:dihydrolipoamide acetyltransferase family protein [Nocardia mexicana]|uniref:Dihydrolipoamide acetyltransferase component of pyruvate dehydrogenase complex n=1 Tax=Nocardia mexicana TaxID=279262 RepID=A0A370HDE8_9NOCA|nr:dihydrolipoamide acetyltransferase family protein [Nocardia mexicana]RDI55247.1 pyruvate dehydrogenase E2 component (dihydrolipoamide acetyltransferase) [Nocardia mexicana]